MLDSLGIVISQNTRKILKKKIAHVLYYMKYLEKMSRELVILISPFLGMISHKTVSYGHTL